MKTRYYVEFVDNNNDENWFMESHYFKNEKSAKRWIVTEFSGINFNNVSVFIHKVNFKKNSNLGDIVLSEKITEKDLEIK